LLFSRQISSRASLDFSIAATNSDQRRESRIVFLSWSGKGGVDLPLSFKRPTTIHLFDIFPAAM
jgi:hypothetical protein